MFEGFKDNYATQDTAESFDPKIWQSIDSFPLKF